MTFRRITLGVAFLALAAGQASAQYYPPPYREGPPPPPPPYREGYGDGYRRGPPPPGGQCDAFLRTPYGPRRVVCPMGRAKPLGDECACPSPDGYGRPAHGHVIP